MSNKENSGNPKKWRPKLSYSIQKCSNEHESLIYLNFDGYSNEFKITTICRFQCIGWILDAVMQLEHELTNGATWMNPESTVKTLMHLTSLPEVLARKLILASYVNERFLLVWDHLTDDEKNTALTVNFDYYHNFWPSFQLYASAISLHLANTSNLNDYKKKANDLASEMQKQSTPILKPNGLEEKTLKHIMMISFESPYHTKKDITYEPEPNLSLVEFSNEDSDILF